MTITKRIGVKKIKLHRAEGKSSECVTREVTTWRQAEELLIGWSYTAPEPGWGYHKCDVWVTYEDGHEFKFRYDLYRLSTGDFESLSKHIHTMFAFNAGVGKPSHFSESDYRRYLNDVVAKYSAPIEDWKMWHDTYEHGEWKV